MASPTRSWHENPPPSQSEMELAVEQSMERLRPWMIPFVTSQLGPSVTPYDFTERIVKYLIPRWRGPLDSGRVDEEVRRAFTQLVHNDCRKEFRRTRDQSYIENDQIPDPHSLDFESQLEHNSQIALIWKYIRNERPDYQPIVDKLFGFHDEEEVKVKQLAKELGVPVDTLWHRLYRFYAELQLRLSRLPRKS